MLLEDDFLVGISLRSALERLGCTVIGPVPTVEEARAVAQDATFECAVLDVNIRGRSSEPIGEILRERDVPFCFVTGFRSPMLLSGEMSQVTRLSKPVVDAQLRGALEEMLALS